jgi:hypothetical protein
MGDAVALAGLLVAVVAVMVGVATFYVNRPGYLDRQVRTSQERFLRARALLKESRVSLAQSARAFYPRFAGGDLPLLFDEGWLPSGPLRLEAVHVVADKLPLDCPPVAGLARSLPLTAAHGRYLRYADAVGDLDRPAQFENHLSYRLVGVEPGDESWTIRVRKTGYFDMLNTCEAVGFEFAAAQLDRQRRRGTANAVPKLPPGRKEVGGPFQLDRRCVVPGVNTLTIRRDGDEASFFMHLRGGRLVATAMGTHHVAPAGEFQPAGVNPTDFVSDADLWRTIVREYAEEFLNLPDAAGSTGRTIDYRRDPPYSLIHKARQTRGCSVYFLGLGIDPLSLKAEILTACVFKADAFDRLFGKMRGRNAEGKLFVGHDNRGMPFDNENVQEFLSGGQETLPAGAACLALAWRWRERLLA